MGILATGCSRKSAPTISLPTEQNPCDDRINALIDSISDVNLVYVTETIYKDGVTTTDTVCIVDSSNCNYYKITALEIAAKYNSAIKERDFYKALAQSQAKKITNNTYINSNNKKSQIGYGNNTQKSKSAPNQNGEANIAQETGKGVNQNGEGNDGTFKAKDSQVGDGNDMDRSKKGSVWPWILVGASGWIIIQNLLWPLAMRFIPFANLTSNIGKALLKLKFW